MTISEAGPDQRHAVPDPAGGKEGITMEEEYKKIIKGLEQSFQYIQQRSNKTASPKATAMNNIRKAIDYITKQETPAQIELEGGGSTWWYVCEECHGAVDKSDSWCKHCGKRLEG